MAEKLLIVDDDIKMCETLSSFIHLKKDYQIELAHSGEEAIRKVKLENYDVVLLDIRLPDMAGIQLLAALKKISPEIEGIMITAYAALEDAIAALNHGAISYITKPFNPDEVVIKIEKAIEKQKKSRELSEKIKELEDIHLLTHDRELKTIELQREANDLLVRLGRPKKYVA